MRALLSVSDKSGLVPFAQQLTAMGCELVSTGGTAKALADSGLAVINVSDVTGFPEMMDGRVKTLHPKVHGGILARRHRPDDLAAIAGHGITPIDLVVVNLYPFAQAAAKPNLPFDHLIEEIDIGGPSMVRAALVALFILPLTLAALRSDLGGFSPSSFLAFMPFQRPASRRRQRWRWPPPA